MKIVPYFFNFLNCRKNCPYSWYACCQGDGCWGYRHCPEIPLRDQRGENSGENQAVGQRHRGRWVHGPDMVFRDGDQCIVQLRTCTFCVLQVHAVRNYWGSVVGDFIGCPHHPMNYETFSLYFKWFNKYMYKQIHEITSQCTIKKLTFHEFGPLEYKWFHMVRYWGWSHWVIRSEARLWYIKYR